MKKWILFCGFIVAWSMTGAIGFDTENPGSVVNGILGRDMSLSAQKQLRDQLLTVPIFMAFPNGSKARCTGTLVGNRSVLTAKHCFMAFIAGYEKFNYQEIPVINNSINIITYTPASRDRFVIAALGNAYKFDLSGNVYRELTPFNKIEDEDKAYKVGSTYYQRIAVSSINTLRRSADMVLLTLVDTPDIIIQGLVDPLNDVTFSNYKTYFTEVTKDQFKSYFEGIRTSFAEMMGFGMPDSYQFLSAAAKRRIGLNLRSSMPSIPVFLKYNSEAMDNLCLEYCFIYSFVNQAADSGDSGGAFSYYEERVEKKNIIGVIAKGGVPSNYGLQPGVAMVFDDSRRVASSVIQGITAIDATTLDQLRRLQ